MSARGWALFAAMGLMWGIPYLLIKVAVGEVAPPTLVFLRTAIGTLLLLPFAASRGGVAALLPRWRWILLYTAVEVAIPWVLLSDAERRLSSSISGLLIAAVPFVAALLVWTTGGEDRPDLRRIVGLIIGFAGVATLVGLDVSTNDFGAVAEVALVDVGYAAGTIIIARRLSDLPTVGVIAASLLITTVVYAPFGIAQLPAAMPSTQALAAIAILGSVCTAAGFIVYFALIAEVGAARATVITYVNPAVALLLGVALLHEPLTLTIALGFVLILLGSVLATRRQTARVSGAAVVKELRGTVR
jgi:drug/metabolite transporter (DMT)-like permease